MRRGPVVAVLAVGVGLIAAPAVFQMFGRAPKGGRMIDSFRPYMTHANVAKFQGYMAEIDRAEKESAGAASQLLATRAGIPASEQAARFPAAAQFDGQWPAIRHDMSEDMLVTMDRMVPNYRAVAALPPFPLFPWFFVLPGAIIAIIAAGALVADRRRRPVSRSLTALVAMGVAVAAAPAVFQMFSRAPMGAEMIDQFRPLMTTRKVSTIQGYFLVLGAGEGELRNRVEQTLVDRGMTRQELGARLPALAAFHRDWPRISLDMAPMIGAMSDNVVNFAAVDALPPFSLFPWFFVLPGVLVVALAIGARGAGREAEVFAGEVAPAIGRRPE